MNVLDYLAERTSPHSPEAVTAEYAALCHRYGFSEVTGDAFAGTWPREAFQKHGILYRVSERTRSEIYLETLPLLTSGRVELLDHKRLLGQFSALERRTARSGKDSVDHPPRGRDDLSNAAAGVLVVTSHASQHFAPMRLGGRPSFPGRTREAGPDLDGQGTRRVGYDGNFITSDGQVFRDPRGL